MYLAEDNKMLSYEKTVERNSNQGPQYFHVFLPQQSLPENLNGSQLRKESV